MPTNSTHSPERSGVRILVVEDDPDICMLISRLASDISLDVDVQFASTVHEATLWLDDGEPFDLILADFLLADSRSGYEMRSLCEERSPTSRFAMMSSMPLQIPEVEKTAFLMKPFSPNEGRAFLETKLSTQ